MTNKEAIENIKGIAYYLQNHTNESCELEHKALTLAIKALEFINENFPESFNDYLNGEQYRE